MEIFWIRAFTLMVLTIFQYLIKICAFLWWRIIVFYFFWWRIFFCIVCISKGFALWELGFSVSLLSTQCTFIIFYHLFWGHMYLLYSRETGLFSWICWVWEFICIMPKCATFVAFSFWRILPSWLSSKLVLVFLILVITLTGLWGIPFAIFSGFHPFSMVPF